jgi:tetratricopeptide (TPR) repeat protein
MPKRPARKPSRADPSSSRSASSAAWPDRWVAVLVASLTAGLTLVAYWPAVHGTLVWDDAGHVTAPALRSLAGLWRIWFSLGATQQYYPLLHSAFWFEHRIWGDSVEGYHVLNIALHLISAGLVVAIMRRLRLPGAWLAAVVFALHPVQVESVAWITEQKNTLSTVFYLGAAFVYLRFDRSRRTADYAAAALLFVCAVLSKSSTATLPAALLVVFWWQRGRLEWRRDVGPLAPWLLFGAAAGLFTAWVERTYIEAQGAEFMLSAVERLLLAGRVVWFYAWKLIWPVNLTFNYPRWTVDLSVWWQWLFPIGLAALGAGCWAIRRTTRGPLASLLFFVGTLFPVLGFFNVYPFRYSYVADHFQYVAALGLIVPGAAIAANAGYRVPRKAARSVESGLGLGLGLVLAALTWHQSGMYKDLETLWRGTIARNPHSWLAHLNLGVELARRPATLPEAIVEFQATVREQPNDVGARKNLAMAYAASGALKEAIAEYDSILRLQPDDAENRTNGARVHDSLANVLASTQQPGAEAEYRAALALWPDFAEAHYDFGTLLMDVPGRSSEAVQQFNEALRIRPDYAEAHHNLAIVLMDVPGGHREAIAHLEAALRIDPTLAATRELLERLRDSASKQ